MYGQIVIPSGLEADRENRYSVKMLRAAARVDVEKDLAADSRPLRIESVAYTARTTKSKSHPTKPSMRNPLGLLRRRYLREP